MLQELWDLLKNYFSVARAFVSILLSIVVLIFIEHYFGPFEEKVIIALFVLVTMLIFLILDQTSKRRVIKRKKK